jgi:hypothetical protein
MNGDSSTVVASRFVDGVAASDAATVAAILAACPTVRVAPGRPYRPLAFPDAAMLFVEDGFVVARAVTRGSGSMITCQAGAARVVLPPVRGEALFGLVRSDVTVISAAARDRLLALPAAAAAVVEHMVRTLGEEQETIGILGYTHHIDRVRGKLLQLARGYGRVAHDGIRIDFPITHVVLAEMVASSRETVTRAVDELQRTGFMSRRGRTYHLLVPPECVVDG